jgi:hypothetical protein
MQNAISFDTALFVRLLEQSGRVCWERDELLARHCEQLIRRGRHESEGSGLASPDSEALQVISARWRGWQRQPTASLSSFRYGGCKVLRLLGVVEDVCGFFQEEDVAT